MSASGDAVWGEMARAGVTPVVFWRLSLRDWRLLTAAPVQARPMGRAELERMAELWPD